MHPSPSTRKGVAGFTNRSPTDRKGVAGFMHPLPDATPTAQASRGVRTRHNAGGTLAT